MYSPFFWRNVCLLLLLLANLAFACWLVFSREVRERLNNLLRPPSVVLRAACLLYATLAGLLFFTALQFFHGLELDAGSRACWRVGQRWAEIQKGMTGRQVVEILGQPLGRDTWTGETVERFRYCLHPHDLPDGNFISFKIERALPADA